MKKIRDLLETKGREIWSIDPDASVFEAIEQMAEKGIGALLVLEDGSPVGIVSERDYARKVILKGRSSRETPVREIMSTPLIHTGPDRSVEDCMSLMTNHRIRHLPVFDGGELAGIVSIGDLVKAIIDEQKFMIEQLESYIAG